MPARFLYNLTKNLTSHLLHKLDDESSDLYSLYEIRDESGNHIHPSAAYDKQYLEGRYGADPYFQNMMDWK